MLVTHQTIILLGQVKTKVVPPNSFGDYNEIESPYVSTVYLTNAKPMRLPSISSRGRSVSNMRKMRSKFCGGMPKASSILRNATLSVAAVAVIRRFPRWFASMRDCVVNQISQLYLQR